MSNLLPFLVPIPKRRVFVSYHHDNDESYYDLFAVWFASISDVVTDRSLDRRVDTDDPEYTMRRIREGHLRGSSCTIVLCGLQTYQRKYVDWEICASLNQEAGLLGVLLPKPWQTPIPARLYDNVASGYAVLVPWSNLVASPYNLRLLLENALARRKALIVNSRPTMRRNAS